MVVGATGKTGRRVAAALGARGVDHRPVSRKSPIAFDWFDRATWGPALEGATAAYLVPPTFTLDDAEVAAFVPRAVEAGVRRLVLLSARGIPDGDGRERAVRESGVDWAVLRPTWFSHNFSEDFFLPQVRAGQVVLPAGGDGAHPFIDARDIADVAVALLTGEGPVGAVHELSGPRALSFPSVLERIGAVSGRTPELVDVAPAAFTAMLVDGGMAPDYAEVLTGSLVAIRGGHDAHVSDGVPAVLGRDARPFEDYLAEASGAWA
ncbi:SDR family NAD(P)-dependent oxidoreductase [Saccharothrix syringae]|uniref:SDR family NAD(P)-dependent oxidoreductase n=1 Tax=Saccharothrix syringae TaxID=103733 RepID=A0A5Q0HEV4_SACSY|nr:SDR family NAD(P)-dependent oxidoreductase [Saccharothrix syringae]